MSAILTAGIDLAPLTARARAAQPAWAALSVHARLRPVEAFRRLLVRDADRVCALVGEEIGKAPAEVLGELLPTADACRFLRRRAGGLLAPRRVPGGDRPWWLFGQSDIVHRMPRGVVGVIGTWNYPLLLNGVQLLQALTAGNAVLWKPSEIAPRFAAWLHGLLLEAGFPADLAQMLPATREMGPALAEADVDHVVFTGSASVGRKLAARLGERLISSTMELSGCDALFVLDDADVGLAARAAWFGATSNRGQTCIAVRRAFVARSLYSAFCEALRPLAGAARPVRLTTAAQVRQARRLVEEALAGGARLLAEPAAAGDDELTPAVLIDVRPEMAVCREASFAPLMAVLPCDSAEQALAADSSCPYALGASIFTRSPRRAEALAAALRAASVCVNDVIVPTAHPATPFGGTGQSGWGTTRGAEGLLEMTVAQVVSRRGGTFRPHYATDDPAQEAMLRGMLAATHGASLGERLRGWWRVVRAATGKPVTP